MLLLDGDETNKTRIEDKMNVRNVAALYHLTRLFKLPSKLAISFIERCFTTFVTSETFLMLDYGSVLRILSSSQLRVDSEVEVFDAMCAWLNYKTTDRGKHAKDLLLKVRLHLLSDGVLKHILDNKLCFINNSECFGIIKHVLDNEQERHLNNSNSRFCNQINFNIVACGGESKRALTSDACSYKANDINNANALAQMKKGRKYTNAVCVRDEVYVFGGQGLRWQPVMSVEKYSASTGAWETVSDMHDNRRLHCACSFMSCVFIVGGVLDQRDTKSCVVFDTTSRKWKEVSEINQAKSNAACVTFEGRVVVVGGDDEDGALLNTVEAYDHGADVWSLMPNMMEARKEHASVAVGNKLFAIGGYNTTSSEVFDSGRGEFVLLKPPPASFKFFYEDIHCEDAVAIGRKFFVFCTDLYSDDRSTRVYCYDSASCEWESEKMLPMTEDRKGFNCTKVAQL